MAIGRALLAKPRLLLMDEPLAALDEARKAEILPYIERLRDEAGVPIVYVSHAVAEVARLATTVIVLEAGRVAASGPAEAILRGPISCRSTRRKPGRSSTWSSREPIPRPGSPADRPGRAAAGAGPGGPRDRDAAARADPRPRRAGGDRASPGLSARNILPGRVATLTPSGAEVSVEIDCNGALIAARVTAAAIRELGLAPGRRSMS